MPVTSTSADVLSPDTIKRLREKCGLSIAQFAKRMAVSEATILQWEEDGAPANYRDALIAQLSYDHDDSPVSFTSWVLLFVAALLFLGWYILG
ncbi:MAG: helix-turn-helix domain-containing protein [Alteromonadaceae bacterium]|nr:helix-turn-helix domain-containing protein [Alteromonadaceae bacterium]